MSALASALATIWGWLSYQLGIRLLPSVAILLARHAEILVGQQRGSLSQ